MTLSVWNIAFARFGLLAAVTLLAAPSYALPDVPLLPIGGSGGGPFTERCASGRILHGIELTVGDTVDSARPICAATLPSGQATNDAAQGAVHGGANRLLQIACPIALPAILAMQVRYGGAGDHPSTVYSITLLCGHANNGPQTPARVPSAEFNGRAPTGSDRLFHAVFATLSAQGQYCPKKQIAVGLNGRSGALLDAIGLICGDPPKR